LSGVTRSQLEAWKPGQLLELATAWRSMGASIESPFDRYVSSVTSTSEGYWEGVAAEATQTRAAGSNPSGTKFRLNGVADNQAIAEIAGAAEDPYQAGSDLDRTLADVGAQYLHAQVENNDGDQIDPAGLHVGGGHHSHRRLQFSGSTGAIADKHARRRHV
jgi:hypothetical protein